MITSLISGGRSGMNNSRAWYEELKRSYQMQAFISIDGGKFQTQIGFVSLEIEGEERVMLPFVLRI